MFRLTALCTVCKRNTYNTDSETPTQINQCNSSPKMRRLFMERQAHWSRLASQIPGVPSKQSFLRSSATPLWYEKPGPLTAAHHSTLAIPFPPFVWHKCRSSIPTPLDKKSQGRTESSAEIVQPHRTFHPLSHRKSSFSGGGDMTTSTTAVSPGSAYSTSRPGDHHTDNSHHPPATSGTISESNE